MNRDRTYLTHIIECITWMESFCVGGKDAFMQDRKTQSAVLRELQVLAESTQRLSDNLKARCPSIPWQAIAGFRNVLVHDYLGLNIERVWSVVVDDIPVLRTAVEKLLQDLAHESTDE